ncbi:3-keto-5-aminohexanoate cleavage protein [Halorussus salilacus]|uniref:3-keto-5-aminohexanoate cleavage protein n=1 Tax=Halorussus salilacus TaxID=2953750 RepID=UPI0020A13553|nr:3-keto-5-aminohexanoate cleavage protein [Halorussus salilacus]USZ67525.1 3-keto-5-aminohexanoate cleavage protein [Halorussus salilacus]
MGPNGSTSDDDRATGRDESLHGNLYDDLPFDELEQSGTFTPEAAKRFFPVHEEDPIDTMDSPVVIECAYPGWQPGGDHYPAVPDTRGEQIQELVDSVEAGAAAVHVHPRDENRRPQWNDNDLLVDVLDPVFEECGDVVTLSQGWSVGPHADYVSGVADLLERGDGNKYCQGGVVLPIGLFGAGTYHSPSSVKEAVRYYEDNGVKPIFQLYDTHVVRDVKRHLIDENEAVWDPFVLCIRAGSHHSMTTTNDPWSYFKVISQLYDVRQTVENSIVGLYPGGRNWLPMLAVGLLAGANVVRVGIEDAYWRYPHGDELIEKNSEVVELTVELAEMLGREVITDPERAREFLGMEYTSPR